MVDVISGNKVNVENRNAYFKAQPFSSYIIVADDIVNSVSEETKADEHNEDKETEVMAGQKYRHYKGGEYEVIAVAQHSETLEELVIYKALYGDGKIWARPKSMFINKVGDVKRFTLL